MKLTIDCRKAPGPRSRRSAGLHPAARRAVAGLFAAHLLLTFGAATAATEPAKAATAAIQPAQSPAAKARAAVKPVRKASARITATPVVASAGAPAAHVSPYALANRRRWETATAHPGHPSAVPPSVRRTRQPIGQAVQH